MAEYSVKPMGMFPQDRHGVYSGTYKSLAVSFTVDNDNPLSHTEVATVNATKFFGLSTPEHRGELIAYLADLEKIDSAFPSAFMHFTAHARESPRESYMNDILTHGGLFVPASIISFMCARGSNGSYAKFGLFQEFLEWVADIMDKQQERWEISRIDEVEKEIADVKLVAASIVEKHTFYERCMRETLEKMIRGPTEESTTDDD